MAEADLGDISKAATRESDVDTLIHTLKKVVQKYGAFLTTRIFAFVLASYKRNRFEEMLSVKESRTAKYSGYPSALVGEDTSGERQPDMGLDHSVLWQQHGKLQYLTSEPYYVTKEQLRHLIAHCHAYGIDFQIDAESCYYPGHAIRMLFKKGYVSQYDALQQMAGEPRAVSKGVS